jgi:hypothetical protein
VELPAVATNFRDAPGRSCCGVEEFHREKRRGGGLWFGFTHCSFSPPLAVSPVRWVIPD